ncbi:alpha/beta fold hydrolase [Pedobacter jejuensis]|uniref:Alpha/beta fold hydrolase n=1 Tax=Pedobacter jejuensis TaxID=1268550 RepID=A0A3N0BW76_9SPHI|nr:alpha/beta fold hydrolase [Pedobacter jejuensis]RNL53959.1 alpha/beta fold hydrolase [Pedobacter jejuensis]
MREEIITIGQHSVVGILTSNGPHETLPTIVMVNAGLIHRIGPNRIYVKLARSLASCGFRVFRYDSGANGDSTKTGADTEMECMKKVMDHLEKKLQHSEFVILGMCSGAELACKAALNDTRIRGIVMINGAGLSKGKISSLYPHSEDMIRRRYYLNAIYQPRKWLKLISLRQITPSFKKIVGILARLFVKSYKHVATDPSSEIADPFTELSKNKVRILLIISEGSIVHDILSLSGVDFKKNDYIFLKGVDHTITPLWAQEELKIHITAWLSNIFKPKNLTHMQHDRT